MGSVGESYRCPWCGRTGAGGYAPDGLVEEGFGIPICTEGLYSCLWFSATDRRLTLPQFRARQLGNIFHGQGPPLEALPVIAKFLLY